MPQRSSWNFIWQFPHFLSKKNWNAFEQKNLKMWKMWKYVDMQKIKSADDDVDEGAEVAEHVVNPGDEEMR